MAESFARRVDRLPRLGLGISTEFDAGRTGLDVLQLAEAHGRLVRFLEIGCDLERGFDGAAERWIATGRPTTYHFLDLNLEDDVPIDRAWMADATALARHAGAAWLCGDAGLWSVGARDRGHGTLMPPVLCDDGASILADRVRELTEFSGLEVLPENPPAQAWLGDLHVLDYFARVADRADCGLLLDAAHLAIHQVARGFEVLDGLDGFPHERVVEIHVAGGVVFEHQGRRFIDDEHGLEVQPETWAILDYLLPRTRNLKAIVLEAERNASDGVVPLFTRLERLWRDAQTHE